MSLRKLRITRRKATMSMNSKSLMLEREKSLNYSILILNELTDAAQGTTRDEIFLVKATMCMKNKGHSSDISATARMFMMAKELK